MLTTQQFDRTRRLALHLAGVELVERHRELLSRRSGRLGFIRDEGWENFLHAVEAGESFAVEQFIRLLTTKFTSFFRHPQHFEVASEHALRLVQERGRARLWSAATATGEESWSLAMALVETFGTDDPPVERPDAAAPAALSGRSGLLARGLLLNPEPRIQKPELGT